MLVVSIVPVRSTVNNFIIVSGWNNQMHKFSTVYYIFIYKFNIYIYIYIYIYTGNISGQLILDRFSEHISIIVLRYANKFKPLISAWSYYWFDAVFSSIPHSFARGGYRSISEEWIVV
jgi:hypothetical protein